MQNPQNPGKRSQADWYFQQKNRQNKKQIYYRLDYSQQFYHMKKLREPQINDYMQCINWDFDYSSPTPPEQNLILNPFPSNISQSESKRISFKNKYINKIKHTFGDRSTNSKLRDKILKDQNNNEDLDKKEKNRMAAKQSRDRKRMYIEIIERQTRQLEEEISKTNHQIQVCKIQIQNSTFHNSQYIGTLTSKLTHVYKKLNKLIIDEQSEERNDEINLAIDSISYRFGATGKERKYSINQSYKHIFNLANPSIHRYLLWAAQENTHIFRPPGQPLNQEDQSWFKQMRNIIGNLDDKQQIVDSQKQQLKKRRKNLFQLILNLSNIKNKMQKQSNDLDNLFLDIREILNPVQSAKFTLFIEKYAYRDELRYHQQKFKVDQTEQKLDVLRKMQKRQ